MCGTFWRSSAFEHERRLWRITALRVIELSGDGLRAALNDTVVDHALKGGTTSETILLVCAGEYRLERRNYRCIKLCFHSLCESETRHPTRHRIAIRTVRRHRVVCVGNGDDPGQRRDLGQREAIGVTLSIDTLMMVPD